ncbi:hypothetical protein H4S06_004521, partial [Coemansia sp. BCRC 34490]
MSKITTRLRNGAKSGQTAVADTAAAAATSTTSSKQKATTRGSKEAAKNASASQRKTTAVHHASPPPRQQQQKKTAITRSSRAKATGGSGNGSTQPKRRKHAVGATAPAKRAGGTQPQPQSPGDPIRPRPSAKTDATISNGANPSAPNSSSGNNAPAAPAAGGPGAKLDGKKRRSKALPPPSLKRTRSKANVTTSAKQPVPLASKKDPRHIAAPRPSETTTLARELSEASISSEETTPTTTPASAAVNFIMSSPKREPRRALTKIRGVPDRGHAASANGHQQQPCRRRRAESSNDEAEESEEGQASGMVRSPPPPPLKRMRIAGPASGMQRLPPAVPLSELPRGSEPGRQPADESSGAKGRARGLAVAGSQGGAQSSPLKAILSPVFDLLRRVSGIAQDPLGLQKHDSRSFIEEEEEAEGGLRALERSTSKENVYPGSPPSETSEVDPAGAPVDSPEANSLTAPPMNPTTLGAAVSAGLSASHGGELHQEEAAGSSGSGSGISRSSSGMQLYLADAGEYQLSDSCSASPLTGTYPETPSKENIPVYGEHDVLVGLDAAETGGIAVLGPAGAELGSGDSDLSLSLSQISSVADTEFDTEAYFAYDEDDEFNPYLFM